MLRISLALILGVLLLGGYAIAQTPGGETPAVEDVCDVDGLTGAAWGLCNAYCEAMDCDSESKQASDVACNKVLERFMDETDGMNPPCLEVVCPCWTVAELTDKTDLWCGDSPPTEGQCTCDEQISDFSTLEIRFTPTGQNPFILVKTLESTQGTLLCAGIGDAFNISRMEYEVCSEQLRYECERFGLPLP